MPVIAVAAVHRNASLLAGYDPLKPATIDPSPETPVAKLASSPPGRSPRFAVPDSVHRKPWFSEYPTTTDPSALTPDARENCDAGAIPTIPLCAVQRNGVSLLVAPTMTEPS